MNQLQEFEFLIDEPVSGISFVLDYIEIYLDGPVVRLLGNVFVSLHGKIVDQRKENFEHILRRIIGEKFLSGTWLEDKEANLFFSGGYELKVVSRGLEFMHLVPTGRDSVLVW